MPTMANEPAAVHLEHIAAMMQLDGANQFRVKAFNEAAKALRDQGYADEVLTSTNVDTVHGAGDTIRAVLSEFLATGTSERYKDLATRHPAECLTMLVVPGIGPKTALKYYAEGIKNFDELVVAAHAGKLKDKVRDAVLFAVKKERVPHDEAKILAQEVIFQLRNQGMIPMLAMKQYEVCGSIRRNSVDSKDVDIVGCVADKKNVDAILDEFVKLGTKISRGENRASIRFTHDGRMMQVDLWLVPPESYGSALVYATGSKDHNIELRKVAIRKNMVLNEYGIFRLANGEVAEKLGGSNEQDVYRVLSLGYQEPWERNETLSVLDTK